VYSELNVADSVKRLCKKRGIAVSNLEKELGWSNGSINRWSRTNPSIEKVFAVAECLGMTLDELLGVKSTKPNVEYLQSDIGEKILQLTERKKIGWTEMDEISLLEFEETDAMRNGYENHGFYRAEWRNGTLFLLVFYKENTDMDIRLYLSVEGGEAEEEKSEQKILMRLLKYIDAKLYKKLNHARIEKYREQLMIYNV